MGIHREEKQMYGLAHGGVHNNFWVIVPIKINSSPKLVTKGEEELWGRDKVTALADLEDISFPWPNLFFASAGSWRIYGADLTLCLVYI